MREGFKRGKRFIETVNTGFGPSRKVVAGSLQNCHVDRIRKGVDLLTLEAMRFVQFVRFSDMGGTLISVIEPENNVLPLLAEHFTERYVNEQFLIYDKTHSLALMYVDYNVSLEHIEHYEMPPADEQEQKYQDLWRLFYDTVEIRERHNERCRLNFMPKKYWKNMTEFLKGIRI